MATQLFTLKGENFGRIISGPDEEGQFWCEFEDGHEDMFTIEGNVSSYERDLVQVGTGVLEVFGWHDTPAGSRYFVVALRLLRDPLPDVDDERERRFLVGQFLVDLTDE